MGGNVLFDQFGFVEKGLKEVGKAFSTSAPKPAAGESQADILQAEAEEDRKRRQAAISGLTQTTSLGAGTPTTQRRKVLGV